MSKSYFHKFLIMLASGLVIGIGVFFSVSANVGTDPLTTFQQGLSNALRLELAICSFLSNVLFAFFIFIVDRKALKITDIVYPFIISAGIKLASYIPLPLHSMGLRVLYFAIALILIGFGIGLGVNSKCGNNPYDGFVLLISKKVNRQFKHIRILMDIMVLIIGIILRGSFGVGTILSMILQGAIGQFFIEFLEKSDFLHKYIEN